MEDRVDRASTAAAPFRGAYVLAVFAALNFFHYATRNVVLPMYADLRASFALTNADLGLLTTAFMAAHAVAAIPAGWLADHVDRLKVVAIGASVWCAGAFGVAAAGGRGDLLAARAVAGLGTGALVPVANALLCDAFPAGAKARTLSIFNLGLFAGGAAGFAIGAVCGYPLGPLLVAGPPAVLAALAARIRVPRRRTARVAPPTWRQFAADCAGTLRVPALRWLMAGAVCVAFAAGGYLAWFVDFVARTKGFSVASGTLFFGGCALTGGLLGVWSGGAIGDWIARRRRGGRLTAFAAGLALAVPFALASIYTDRGWAFYAVAWGLMYFISWYHGPLAAAVDDLVPPARAATAQAALIASMHLVGTAPSAWIVGLAADAVGLRSALLVPTAALAIAAACGAIGARRAAR